MPARDTSRQHLDATRSNTVTARTVTVTFYGTDDAFDAANLTTTDEHDSPGMTQEEGLADILAAALAADPPVAQLAAIHRITWVVDAGGPR